MLNAENAENTQLRHLRCFTFFSMNSTVTMSESVYQVETHFHKRRIPGFHDFPPYLDEGMSNVIVTLIYLILKKYREGEEWRLRLFSHPRFSWKVSVLTTHMGGVRSKLVPCISSVVYTGSFAVIDSLSKIANILCEGVNWLYLPLFHLSEYWPRLLISAVYLIL